MLLPLLAFPFAAVANEVRHDLVVACGAAYRAVDHKPATFALLAGFVDQAHNGMFEVSIRMLTTDERLPEIGQCTFSASSELHGAVLDVPMSEQPVLLRFMRSGAAMALAMVKSPAPQQ